MNKEPVTSVCMCCAEKIKKKTQRLFDEFSYFFKLQWCRNLTCLCKFLEVYKQLRRFECQLNSKKKIFKY